MSSAPTPAEAGPDGPEPDELEEVCGLSFDHDLPEPEYIDGFAVIVCRNCGGELMLNSEEEQGS